MILIVQIAVIAAAARIAGTVFRRIGQPAVVGEMVAGILLGPSCFGLVAPATHAQLFGARSLPALQQLSQAGVILYMFVVGAETDVSLLSAHARAAVAISAAGIAAPFVLGCALSAWLWTWLAPPHVPFLPFALFLGTAMSITAFPVLARNLAERRMIGTPLGATALACAAADDVSSWCLLATVVAIVNAQAPSHALVTVALTVGFAAAMLLAVRPAFARIVIGPLDGVRREAVALGAVAAFVGASAFATSAIGVHAIFGAFLAGVAMSPRRELARLVRRRVDTIAALVLVPLFFAVAGLRTEIVRVDTAAGWAACAAIVVVAIGGKFGGVTLAARLTGVGWRAALTLGVLMNTRGLMELIVLNVGYDLGILSTPLFAMMVIMALVTTAMTSPAVRALEVRGAAPALPA